MKKVLIIFWYLILANNINNVHGQEIISSDSLLKLFQVMKPFEVFEKVQFTWFDFRTCYNDTSLKPYLMKWMDRHEYFEFVLDKEKRTIANRPDLIKDEILYMLNKQGRRKALDTILTTPALYSQYRDSAISVYVNRYIENYKGEHKVPDRAIIIHSYLAYPESYTIIKQWWKESGLKNENNEYFLPFLRIGDPDARRIFDEKIRQCVKDNGESSNMVKINSALNGLSNSYSVIKLIELLSVDIHYEKFSEGDSGMPVNSFFEVL